MKNTFSVPSASLETIFEVDAELQPPPPAEDTVVVAVSSPRSFATAGSSFIVYYVVDLRSEVCIRVRKWVLTVPHQIVNMT
jgi:hypothetical protein